MITCCVSTILPRPDVHIVKYLILLHMPSLPTLFLLSEQDMPMNNNQVGETLGRLCALMMHLKCFNRNLWHDYYAKFCDFQVNKTLLQ